MICKVLSTTIFMIFHMQNLSFRIQTAYCPLIIIMFQYMHSELKNINLRYPISDWNLSVKAIAYFKYQFFVERGKLVFKGFDAGRSFWQHFAEQSFRQHLKISVGDTMAMFMPTVYPFSNQLTLWWLRQKHSMVFSFLFFYFYWLVP